MTVTGDAITLTFPDDPSLAALIDALPMHVAILDRRGTIQAVNGQWRDYARSNGADEQACGVGVNYLGAGRFRLCRLA